MKNEKNVIFWDVPAHFESKTIEKSRFLDFCGCEKCKNRNFGLVFMQNLIFGILSDVREQLSKQKIQIHPILFTETHFYLRIYLGFRG